MTGISSSTKIALIATALWFVLKSKSQKDETVH